MRRLALLKPILLVMFLSPASAGWAQVRWIPEQERAAAKLTGDFRTPAGAKISFKDLKGKVVFLNFWATWCAPCKQEMPSMARLHAQLRQQGLEMIAITTDKRDEVRKFVADHSIDFTVVLDPNDSLGIRFRTEIVPTTIIIDGQGRIAMRHAGAMEWDTQETVEALRKLLRTAQR